MSPGPGSAPQGPSVVTAAAALGFAASVRCVLFRRPVCLPSASRRAHPWGQCAQPQLDRREWGGGGPAREDAAHWFPGRVFTPTPPVTGLPGAHLSPIGRVASLLMERPFPPGLWGLWVVFVVRRVGPGLGALSGCLRSCLQRVAEWRLRPRPLGAGPCVCPAPKTRRLPSPGLPGAGPLQGQLVEDAAC